MLENWTNGSTLIARVSGARQTSFSRLLLFLSLLEKLLQVTDKLLDGKVNEYFPKTFMTLGVLLNKIDSSAAKTSGSRPSSRPDTPNRGTAVVSMQPNHSTKDLSGSSEKNMQRSTQGGVGLNFRKEDAILSSVLGAKKRESINAILKTAPDELSQKKSDEANSLKGRNIRPIILPVVSSQQKRKSFEREEPNSSSFKTSEKGKKELFKILQSVENRNILINKKTLNSNGNKSGRSGQNSLNNSTSNRSGTRSPIKIMKLVGPESSVEDSEKRRKYKPPIRDGQISDLMGENFNITRTEINVDFTKTMPAFPEKDDFEPKKSAGKKIKHMKTSISVNSDSEEVGLSSSANPHLGQHDIQRILESLSVCEQEEPDTGQTTRTAEALFF